MMMHHDDDGALAALPAADAARAHDGHVAVPCSFACYSPEALHGKFSCHCCHNCSQGRLAPRARAGQLWPTGSVGRGAQGQ